MTFPGLSRSLIRDRTWNFFMDAIVFAVLFAVDLCGRSGGALLVQHSCGGGHNFAFTRGAFRVTPFTRWCA